MSCCCGRASCGVVHQLLSLATGSLIMVLAVVLFLEKFPNSESCDWPKPLAGVLVVLAISCLLQAIRAIRQYVNPGVLESLGGCVAGISGGLLLYSFIQNPMPLKQFAQYVVDEALYSVALVTCGISVACVGCLGTLIGVDAWIQGMTYVPHLGAAVGVILFYISVWMTIATNTALSLSAARLFGTSPPLLPVIFGVSVPIIFFSAVLRRRWCKIISILQSLLIALCLLCQGFFLVASIVQMKQPAAWLTFQRPIMIGGLGTTMALLLLTLIFHLTTTIKHRLRTQGIPGRGGHDIV